MARIGYARVSSKAQNLDRQIEKLNSANIDKIFVEKISGKDLERPELQKMLDYIREDDIVVVCELDRLGRNNDNLSEIIRIINRKGATLEVLNLPSLVGVEDKNLRMLINNLILEIFKYQAESEREKIKERQRQGIEIAKAKGRYKGGRRKYSIKSPKLQHALKLFHAGETEARIEEITGINRRTFKRYRDRYNIRERGNSVYTEHDYNKLKGSLSREQFDDYVAQEKEIIDLVMNEGVSSRTKLYKYKLQPLVWALDFFTTNENEEYKKLINSVLHTKKYGEYSM